jgi:Glyoxalase-like domain
MEHSHPAAGCQPTAGLDTDADAVRYVRGRVGRRAYLCNPDCTRPGLSFLKVAEPKTAKNRLHLDVSVDPDQLDSEAARLCSAGATVYGYNEYPGHRPVLMRDPEGNEFDLH